MAKKEFLSFEGLQRLVDNINSLKANIDSPIFKGKPISPTPDINDKSTRIATTEYVNNIADKLRLEAGESVQKETDALGKRIDNLILSSGTESSAEVIDARTGYDGTAYDTLGTAIRSQVSEINSDLGNLRFSITENNLLHVERKA